MNIKKNVNIYYALVQSTYWMSCATIGAFTSAYLLGVGVNNSTIGLVLAVAGAVAALVSPKVGQLIDRNIKISNKLVLMLLAAFIAAICLLTYFWKGKPNGVDSLLFGIATFVMLLTQPFTNSLAMATINAEYKLNFGPTRACGAIGYAVASALVGQLTVHFGTGIIPLAGGLLFFLNAVMLYIYPVDEKRLLRAQAVDSTQIGQDGRSDRSSSSGKPAKTSLSAFAFLKKYKLFSIMLVAMTLLYFSHMLINIFTLQVIQTKGGNSDSMGIATALAAASETITMIFFGLYIKKFKLHNIIRISGIFFISKIFFSLIVPNVGWFYVIQIFQMFGWGFLATGIVFYVNELVDPADTAQGQAFAGMTLTLGNVLSALIGGVLLDKTNVPTMLTVGTISAVIGTIILFLSTKETNPQGCE